MPREALLGEGEPAEMRRVCNNWRGNSHYSSMPCHAMHAATSHASEIAVARRARPHYPVYCGRTSRCSKTSCKCVCAWVGGWDCQSHRIRSIVLSRQGPPRCLLLEHAVGEGQRSTASFTIRLNFGAFLFAWYYYSCPTGLAVLLLLDICHDPEDMWIVVV